jgi:mannosyltransferase
MKEQVGKDERGRADRVSRFFLALPSSIRYFLMNLKSMVVQDNYLKILIILTITGLILRLWHLGDVSFWLDETLTNYYSHRTPLEIWHIGTYGVNPPTFYWIEHIMLYFGSGEIVLRLVPVLAGTCTIPVFYLLGREFYTRETGLVAAALLTVSTFHIYYSQEARPYTLFLLCFSIALIFYLRAWRTNSKSAWMIFGIFSALTCWAHLFGFVFIFPLFLLFLMVKFLTKKTGIPDLKPVIMAGAIWILLSMPMLLVMVKAGYSKTAAPEPWGLHGIALITATIKDVTGGYYAGIILLSILFMAGLFRILLNDRKRFLFIAGALVLPLAITVVLSYRMAIVPRYLIGLLPFFYLGIAYAIGSVNRRIFTVRFSCIAILLLVAISVPSLSLYYSADSKNGQDWKDFSQKLRNLTGTGDRILIYPGYEATSLTYYYNNRTKHTFIIHIKNETDLDGFFTQNTDLKKMLIIVGSRNVKPEGEMGQWISSHAVLVEKDEELYLYRINTTINPGKSG